MDKNYIPLTKEYNGKVKCALAGTDKCWHRLRKQKPDCICDIMAFNMMRMLHTFEEIYKEGE